MNESLVRVDRHAAPMGTQAADNPDRGVLRWPRYGLRGLLLLTLIVALFSAGVSWLMRPSEEARLLRRDRAIFSSGIAAIPAQVGDWVLATSTKVDVSSVAGVEIVGAVHRQYRNRATGATVDFCLLCAPPRVVCAHPWSHMRAYTVADGSTLVTDGEHCELSVVDGPRRIPACTDIIQTPTPGGQDLTRAIATWGADGKWSVCDLGFWDLPTEFEGEKLLFRLAFCARMASRDESVEDSGAATFASAMIPKIERIMAEYSDREGTTVVTAR